MSVVVIRVWNEMRKEEFEEKWRIRLERRGGKFRFKKKKNKKVIEGEVKVVIIDVEEEKVEKEGIMEVEGNVLVEVKEGEEFVVGFLNGVGVVSYIKMFLEFWLICNFRVNFGCFLLIFLKFLLLLVFGLFDMLKKFLMLSMFLLMIFYFLFVKLWGEM